MNKQDKKALEKGIKGWKKFCEVMKGANADEKKKQLLEMAKRCELKPNCKTTLGQALQRYICKSGDCYDSIFDKQIRKEAPSWFIDTIANKKKQLLAMAKRGDPRPNWKKHLGTALKSYTNKSQRCCDPIFDKEIRKLAPHWFVNAFVNAAENKKQLLAIAKRGEPRPRQKKHPLGKALNSYTSKKSSSYDLVFDKQIRKEVPHWFVGTVANKKKQLLEMAKNGEQKPHFRTPLGIALKGYISKSHGCYDPIFEKQIKLAPHWFVGTVAEKKKQLIEMAKRGEPRPNQRKHPLGNVLGGYTCKSSRCYDPIFDKQIRKLAPHWFKSDLIFEKQIKLAPHWFVGTVAEKKKQLIEMAKRGEPRPNQRKHPLGLILSSYTCKSHGCYDPIFDKQIRKLAPHWFKSIKKPARS